MAARPCDESRPVCSNCQQRQEPCDYDTQLPFIWADRTGRSKEREIESSNPSQLKEHVPTETAFSFLHRAGVTGAQMVPAPSLDMSQLKLLVRWQADTYKTFVRSEETKHVWQALVVEEALHNPFLMHGILAVSALHVSLTEAELEKTFWLGLASAHNSEALHLFVRRLTDINSTNAKAMVGFAGLVVAFAFGSALTGLSEPDKPSLDALNNIFVLCRGVQETTNTAFSQLLKGTFAPLFDARVPQAAVPRKVKQALEYLTNLNAERSVESGHEAATYMPAIEALRDLSVYTYAQPASLTLAVGWAIKATPAYLDHVQMKRPFALVVHAYYCAFLHISRGNCCIGSWGKCVLEEIYHILDPDWRAHIRWPVEEVFGDDVIKYHTAQALQISERQRK
ncbi:Zn(II)2Cys6 transcription factor [Aspergillus udagawae]|nr:Zn(II)2Cys6 transcription factor [Aspergillus udagawae]